MRCTGFIFLCLMALASSAELVAAQEAPVTLQNLAAKKTVTASSVRNRMPAQNAVDGDPKTRWSAADAESPAWIAVDLGAAVAAGGCEIRWERGVITYRYLIEGSLDGTNWFTLNDQRGTDERGQVQKLLLPGGKARHIRISTSPLEKGVVTSIAEIAIYDSVEMKRLAAAQLAEFQPSAPFFENVALNKPAIASSTQGGRAAGLAVDGDPRTRWCAGDQTKPQWIEIDLQKPADFNEVEIRWENAKAVYRSLLEGSADGITWKVLADQRGNVDAVPIQRLAIEATAIRYLRLTVAGITQDSTWASITEFKAYHRPQRVAAEPHIGEAGSPTRSSKE